MPRPTQNDKRQQTGRIPGQLERVQRQTPGVYETPETLDVSQQGQMRFGANAQSAFRTDESLAGQLLKQLRPAAEIITAIDRDRTRQDRELAEDLQMSADKIIANPNLDQKTKLGLINTQYSNAKPKTKRFEAIFNNQAAGSQAKINALNDDEFFLNWVSNIKKQNMKNPVISGNPDIPSKSEFRAASVEDASKRYPHLADRFNAWLKNSEIKDYEKQYEFIYKFATSQAKNELNMLAIENPSVFTDDMGGLNQTISSTVFEMAKENGIPVELIRDNPSIMQDIQFLVKGKTEEVQRIQNFQYEIGYAQKGQQDLYAGNLEFDETVGLSDLNPAQMFKAWSQGRELLPLTPETREKGLYDTWSGIQDIKKMQFNVKTSDGLFLAITKYNPALYEGEEAQKLVAQLIEDPSLLDMEFRSQNVDLIQNVIEQTSNLYLNDFMKSLSEEERTILLNKIGKDNRVLREQPNTTGIDTPPSLRQENLMRAALNPNPSTLDLRSMESLSQTVDALIKAKTKDGEDEELTALTDLRNKADFDNRNPSAEARTARAQLARDNADITMTPEDVDKDAARASDALTDLNTGVNPSNEEDGGQTLIGYSLVAQRYAGDVKSLNEWLDFWSNTGKNPEASEFNSFYNRRYDESSDFDFSSITNPVAATVGELRELQQRFPDDARLNGIIDAYDGTDDSKDKTSDFLFRFDTLVGTLKNLKADDPLLPYATELKGKRELLLQNISKNVAQESPLYDYQSNGTITLTRDNNIAIPFLLADAASQQANNGVYNDTSAGVLAERMEQLSSSYRESATNPEGKTNWFRKNKDVMATLMSLSGTKGFSFSDNKILKKATFGLLGSIYGLSDKTIINMRSFTPDNNPRGHVFNNVVMNRLGPLLEAAQNEGEETVLNISKYLNTAYTQVTDIRNENYEIELGTLDLNFNPELISHNFVPYAEEYFGGTLSYLGREIGGDILKTMTAGVIDVDPYQPMPSKETIVNNRLAVSLGSTVTNNKDSVALEKDLQNSLVQHIFNFNGGLLVQQAGQDGALAKAFDAGLLSADNNLRVAANPSVQTVVDTATASGVTFAVALLPNANEEVNHRSRLMGSTNDDGNPYEMVIIPTVDRGKGKQGLVIPTAISPEYQTQFDGQLSLWDAANTLDVRIKNQNLLLSNMTAPSNSGELIKKRFFDRVELTDDQRDKVNEIIDRAMWERGPKTGPASRVRTSGPNGEVFEGGEATMEYGPSYFGLHSASTVLSYLERAVKSDELDLDKTIIDLRNSLETVDTGVFRGAPPNNIVSFCTYNENEGVYDFYIKDGAGERQVEGDEIMNISDPSDYLNFVADGGIRTYANLGRSTPGREYDNEGAFIIKNNGIRQKDEDERIKILR